MCLHELLVIPLRQNAQELDMRNRGTEIIKVRKTGSRVDPKASRNSASQGPEMLELDFVPCNEKLRRRAIATAVVFLARSRQNAEVSRRDSKAHDRRKRVGTSKATAKWHQQIPNAKIIENLSSP